MALHHKPSAKGNTVKLNSCGITGIKSIKNVKYTKLTM